MSLPERLARLLLIVPYVAHRDGVPLQELAQSLDVSPRQIEDDVQLLAMVGQPPLTPDHLIDLYQEDDVVYVDLDQSLSRPLRLTHEEARALVLAAKLLGNLGGLGGELERVLSKIVSLLNPVDQQMVRELSERIALGDDAAATLEPVAQLRAAIDEHREVLVEYYSASSDRHRRYRLKPLAVFTHSGAEYLVALDAGVADQQKLFRLDRLGALTPTEDTFAPPADVDLEKFRTQRLYFGPDAYTAQVRFAPERAMELRERFGERDMQQNPDGSVTVRLATSSAAWLARWALQYGDDAEVIGPPEQRAYMRQLCTDALRAYAAGAGGEAP
jgi:proteasome accessory factor C